MTEPESHFTPHALRVSTLSKNAPTSFELRPGKEETEAIASALDLLGLRKLSFTGEIMTTGKSDWLLKGHLGATVVQPCSVTLAPVTTRLEENVLRRFTPHLPDDLPDEEEVEMPEDDSLEQLGNHIDPGTVMAEALALALPMYPRAEGAALQPDEAVHTKPGETPLKDEDLKPFAGLANLMAARDKKGENEDPDESGS